MGCPAEIGQSSLTKWGKNPEPTRKPETAVAPLKQLGFWGSFREVGRREIGVLPRSMSWVGVTLTWTVQRRYQQHFPQSVLDALWCSMGQALGLSGVDPLWVSHNSFSMFSFLSCLCDLLPTYYLTPGSFICVLPSSCFSPSRWPSLLHDILSVVHTAISVLHFVSGHCPQWPTFGPGTLKCSQVVCSCLLELSHFSFRVCGKVDCIG